MFNLNQYLGNINYFLCFQFYLKYFPAHYTVYCIYIKIFHYDIKLFANGNHSPYIHSLLNRINKKKTCLRNIKKIKNMNILFFVIF